MNAQSFLEEFSHFVNAPDGIKRLREMILHCAVSGRLVEKINSEGKADGAVIDAMALRDRYREGFKIRKRKLAGELRENELLFGIPEHWSWARLESIACYIQRGKGPKYAVSGVGRVVSQKCIQWAGFNLSLARTISDESLEKYGGERFLKKNDILWNSTGTGTAGRVALYDCNGQSIVADSHVTVIRLTNFMPQYIWCYLASPAIQAKMAPNQEGSMVSGTTNQVELSTAKVSELPIPCPPVEEQKRIVKKVDELMALCDKLEAQQEERERVFPVLSRATHTRLAVSPTSEKLQAIFDADGSVSTEDLRKTILSLAVSGALVPQNLKDEPAEELIIKIARDRDRLVKEKEIPKPKKLNAPGEKPFSLPVFWCWAQLGAITHRIEYGSSQKSNDDTYEVPVYRMGDIQGGLLYDTRLKYVPREIDDLPRLFLQPGDILFNRTNSAELVGKAAIFRGPPNSHTFASYLIRVQVPWHHLNSEFINICFRSPYFRETQIEPEIVQQCGQANFNGTKLAHTLFPIPPLVEQERIVGKVDQLMGLVDKLEQQQTEKCKVAAAYSLAAVAAITGSKTKQIEAMKAPKTELITKLEIGTKPKTSDTAPLASLFAKKKEGLSAKVLWQQSGLEIDAFYQQLKTEMTKGWIVEPNEAEMKIVEKV